MRRPPLLGGPGAREARARPARAEHVSSARPPNQVVGGGGPTGHALRLPHPVPPAPFGKLLLPGHGLQRDALLLREFSLAPMLRSGALSIRWRSHMQCRRRSQRKGGRQRAGKGSQRPQCQVRLRRVRPPRASAARAAVPAFARTFGPRGRRGPAPRRRPPRQRGRLCRQRYATFAIRTSTFPARTAFVCPRQPVSNVGYSASTATS